MNAAGRPLASGGSYISLEASFAAARRHAARFGAAPVKVNLRDVEARSIDRRGFAAERGTMAAHIDQKSVRREQRRTRALAPLATAARPAGGRYAR